MRGYVTKLIETLTPLQPRRGVEIGVWRGGSAYYLLRKFPDLHLLLVDSYDQENMLACEPVRYAHASVNEAKADAKKLLLPFDDRCSWFVMPSIEAAEFIQDGSLDFAWVDADHRYKGTRQDIRKYRPKIRSGGRMVGDDHTRKYPGVARAVREEFGGDAVLVGRRHTIWYMEMP